jgi:hypothetical protein
MVTQTVLSLKKGENTDPVNLFRDYYLWFSQENVAYCSREIMLLLFAETLLLPIPGKGPVVILNEFSHK